MGRGPQPHTGLSEFDGPILQFSTPYIRKIVFAAADDAGPGTFTSIHHQAR
jgi:hypothetical protein